MIAEREFINGLAPRHAVRAAAAQRRLRRRGMRVQWVRMQGSGKSGNALKEGRIMARYMDAQTRKLVFVVDNGKWN